jgi:hypothetical protein
MRIRNKLAAVACGWLLALGLLSPLYADGISPGGPGFSDGINNPLNTGVKFFVATAGSDLNAGTLALPWQTIAKVNSSATAGSTVKLNGGDTFATTTGITVNVSVTSYGTGQATITSGNSAPCISETNPTLAASISNIVCTGGGNATNTTAGIAFTNSQAGNTKLTGPTITGVTVSGYGFNGISIEGTNGNSGFNGTSITGNIVHDCTGNSIGSGQWGTAGIYIFSKVSSAGYAHTSNYIAHNTVYNITGKTGASIWVGSGILTSESNGTLTEYNVVHDFGVNSATLDPVGIWTQDSTNTVIGHNEVYNGLTIAGGFDIDQNCTNCRVEYNYAHDNAGWNYLASHGGSGTYATNTFRFNIGQNSAKGEMGFFFITSAPGPLYVYNNTFSNFVTGVIFNRGSDVGGTITAKVANNIVAASGGNILNMVVPGSISFFGNDYYTYGQAVSISWNGSTYASVAAWQVATSQDATALTSNPSIYVPGGGFTNGGYVPANLMAYNLQSGSPMVGAGLNVTTQFSIDPGTQDYYGTSITAATLPVGAAAGDFTTFAATSTAASAFLARVSSFTKADNVNYNSLLSGMVSDGDFALIDTLYILAAPNTAASLLNLASSSFSLVSHGTTTFTARTGIAGNGSTGYLDTQFTGNAGSPNFLQDSATLAAYNRTTTAPSTDHSLIGNAAVSGMYNDISVQVTSGTFCAVNEGGSGNGFNIGQGNVAPNGSAGYLVAQRTAPTVATGYYNGATGTGTSEVSASIASSTSFTLLAGNFLPSIASFSIEQVSAALIGGGTVSPKRTSRRINSFMQAYGINTY